MKSGSLLAERAGAMKISESADYDQLVDLFIENGLEFSKDKPLDNAAVVKCWKAELNGQLIAGCMLTCREGHYRLEGLAVKEDFRNSAIGSTLLECSLEHLRGRNAAALYLVAKVPGFYKKHGFRIINRQEAPITVKCFSCSQYNASCFPAVMKIDI